MIKSKKVIAAIITLCISLGLTSNYLNVNASDNNSGKTYIQEDASPYNTNIKYSTVSLSFSGSQAICDASVTGYSSNTSTVSIYMYLEKYTNGGWSSVNSWSGTRQSYTMSLSGTSPVSRGTYRVKASYYAGSENIVKYSSEQTV